VEEELVAMKMANAVSLGLEGPGKRTSFDEKLAPITSEATAADINLSSGESYPTPALNGAAIAMRLDTFLNLPAQDTSLMDPWPANLELAFNLWLCADGIDIVQDAEVTSFEENPMVPLEPEMAARFAAVWMDDFVASKFLQAYSTKITRLDWETKMMHARQSETFPKNVAKKCRSFEWYAKEINSDLSKVLEQVAWDEQKPLEKEKEIKVAAEKPVLVTPKQVQRQEAPPKQEEPAKKPIQVEEHEHEEAPKVEEKHEEPPQKEEQHAEPPPADEEEDPNAIPNLAQNHLKRPSVPLRKENLEIIQKAKPIDISFVDVSGGHKEHPHMGAKDADGNWGYVHDETALHQSPPKFTFEADKEKEACMKRDNNFKMMTSRVIVDTEYDKRQNESGVKRDKIFCFVYTIESGHRKIPLIRETWG
jgi:hypothetical protein